MPNTDDAQNPSPKNKNRKEKKGDRSQANPKLARAKILTQTRCCCV